MILYYVFDFLFREMQQLRIVSCHFVKWGSLVKLSLQLHHFKLFREIGFEWLFSFYVFMFFFKINYSTSLRKLQILNTECYVGGWIVTRGSLDRFLLTSSRHSRASHLCKEFLCFARTWFRLENWDLDVGNLRIKL
jgi:hypothetical protein